MVTKVESVVPWAHVSAIIFLAEAHVYPCHIFGEECCAGTESYCEELGIECQLRG